jgi:hypothetical protein
MGVSAREAIARYRPERTVPRLWRLCDVAEAVDVPERRLSLTSTGEPTE